MDDKRKYFTIIWKIKNFGFLFNSNEAALFSPYFFIHEMYISKWYLVLNPRFISCNLRGEYPNTPGFPDKFELDHELSFLAGDGSVIASHISLHDVFEVKYFFRKSLLISKREDLFKYKKNLFMSDDTLTIRYRIRKSQESFSKSGICTIESRIDTERRTFFGKIEKFSTLVTNSKNSLAISYAEPRFPICSMNLCIDNDGKLNVEIQLIENKFAEMYIIKVFIMDVYGNKVKSHDVEICGEKRFCIPLTFSRERLIKNKELYLQYDVLTFQCEVIFPVRDVSRCLKTVNDITYEYDCEDVQVATANATNVNFSSEDLLSQSLMDGSNSTNESFSLKEGGTNTTNANSSCEGHHTDSMPTLIDGLITLFREGILCDTKLKTTTEAFPAHIVVLSAQSSVFKAMFTTEMREKTNKCVDIEDLTADTVRKMLLFMYTDTLDNLDYESAKSLYSAADKYNIVSLKRKCSNFLKHNLLFSNCAEVLLFAELYQDMELKGCAQDCIAENDEVVLSSDEWKKLEEDHPRLTIETLRVLYSSMKNRRT